MRERLSKASEVFWEKILGDELLQFVIVVDTLVESVEGHTLGGKAGRITAGRLKDVAWVQLLAQLDS